MINKHVSKNAIGAVETGNNETGVGSYGFSFGIGFGGGGWRGDSENDGSSAGGIRDENFDPAGCSMGRCNPWGSGRG